MVFMLGTVETKLRRPKAGAWVGISLAMALLGRFTADGEGLLTKPGWANFIDQQVFLGVVYKS